jgi:hypothetical protein
MVAIVRLFLVVAIASVIYSLGSCQQYPSKVQQALSLAGENAPELRKVISHYSQKPQDSLKLKSAYFLIANMPGKFYYEGSLIKKYYQYLSNIEASPALLDSIEDAYGPFDYSKLITKFDINEIKASYLISNIDMAFKVWKEQPWGKSINFNQFCEYILPYRNGNEAPSFDRFKFYAKYNYLLDSVKMVGGDALQACYTINNALKKEGWKFVIQGGFLPYFSADQLISQRKGNCRDMVSKTIFVMRALGIPVAVEFTPNWGNRNGGHMWNVVLDKAGKNHPFMGTENNDSREVDGGTHYTLAKVYLNTFSSQDAVQHLLNKTEGDVPELFKNKYIKDVTGEIEGSGDITVQLDQDERAGKSIVYLCVFNNFEWIPIDWAQAKGNLASFKKVLGNVVYLPAYYEGKSLIPAGLPFRLSQELKLRYFTADQSATGKVFVFRKYPVFMKADYAEHMFGGKFQAAVDAQFSKPKTIWVIPYPEVEMRWYQVAVQPDKAYKYYRYVSPENGFGNIAELQFFSQGKMLQGHPVGTPGSFMNIPEDYFTAAFDGNEATSFNYKESANGWTGLEFSKPERVSMIRFLPRNDDNGIDVGQKYELVYWNHHKWVSAGRHVATSDSIVFDHVPGNALLLLHNLTKGKEERIFSYEGSKQIWW